MTPTDPYSWVLWQLGYTICHQMSDRSLFVDGEQYPIDARMSGLFLSFAITSLLLYALGRWRLPALPDKIVMGAAAIGTFAFAIDGVTSYSGLWTTTNLIRIITGLLMGTGIALLMPPLYRLIVGGLTAPPVDGSPVATWKDLPIVYAVVFLVGGAVYATSSGAWFYYIIATTVVAGYLLLFQTIIRLVSISVLVPRYAILRDPRNLLLATLLLQALFTGILWCAHHLVDAYLRVR